MACEAVSTEAFTPQNTELPGQQCFQNWEVEKGQTGFELKLFGLVQAHVYLVFPGPDFIYDRIWFAVSSC